MRQPWGGGADLAEGFALACAQLAVVPLSVRQPQRQGRSQAFAAGLIGRQPDDAHDRLDERVARFGAGMRAPARRGHGVAQEFDGILALVALEIGRASCRERVWR